MDEVAQALGRAFRVDAPQGGFILQVYHRRPAGRADPRHMVRHSVFAVARHTDDFRMISPACAPEWHPQYRRPVDSDDNPHYEGWHGKRWYPPETPGQTGGGSQNAGAAHVDFNITRKVVSLTSGGYLNAIAQRRELVGGAQGLTRIRSLTLITAPSISKSSAARFGRFAGSLQWHPRYRGIYVITRGYREAQTLDIIQRFAVDGKGFALHLLDVEYEDGKPAGCR